MAAKKRIAVALEYPLAQKGGTQALARALMLGMRENFEIVLVSGDKSQADLPKEFSGLISSHFQWSVQPKSAEPAKKLAEELRRQNIQLAHFHFGGTYVWGSNRFWRCPIYYFAKGGVPCVSTNHLAAEWLDCGVNPKRPIWQKQLYQLFAIFSRSQIFRRLKFEICVSKHDQERVHRQFPFYRNKIIQVYHSLLNDAGPLPTLENRARIILNVGHLAQRKGQFVLAMAFSKIAGRHPDWKLQFAGGDSEGIETKKINQLIQEKQLEGRIELLGERNDAIDLMRRSTIYVQPSFKEGLPLGPQEALFNGCAVIGTRAGGTPELIDDGNNGLLVDPGNADQLATALERMISDSMFRGQCATRARQSILDKGMTLGKMVEKYRALYSAILRPD
jgi:glycosyltransferase involved in cell wall biosynthesis